MFCWLKNLIEHPSEYIAEQFLNDEVFFLCVVIKNFGLIDFPDGEKWSAFSQEMNTQKVRTQMHSPKA